MAQVLRIARATQNREAKTSDVGLGHRLKKKKVKKNAGCQCILTGGGKGAGWGGRGADGEQQIQAGAI